MRTIINLTEDYYKEKRRRERNKKIFIFVLCCLCFIGGFFLASCMGNQAFRIGICLH